MDSERIMHPYYNRQANRRCKYLNCSTSSLNKGKRLYRFPKDAERCALWIASAKNPKLKGKTPDILYKTAHLCDSHFADWCFMNKNDKLRLVFNAVPDKEKTSMPVVKQKPLIEVASNIPTSPINDFNSLTKNNRPTFICNAVSDLDKSCVTAVNVEPLPEVASIIHANAVPDKEKTSILLDMLLDKQKPSIEVASNIPAGPTNDFKSLNKNDRPTLICNAVSDLEKSCVPVVKEEPMIEVASIIHVKSRKRYTARESQMAKIIKNKNDIIRKLRKKTESLKKLVGINGPKKQHLRTILEKTNVKTKLVDFILRQVQLSVNPQNRRFNADEKIFAHKIYSESRSVYMLLKSLFYLPSEQTLQRFLKSDQFSTEDSILYDLLTTREGTEGK